MVNGICECEIITLSNSRLRIAALFSFFFLNWFFAVLEHCVAACMLSGESQNGCRVCLQEKREILKATE